MIKPSERRRAAPVVESDWRNSRIVVAAASAAATAGLMGGVVLPQTISYWSAKVDTLNGKVESLTAAAAASKGLSEELEATRKRLANAEAQALDARAAAPFAPGSVYPAGIDRVVLGSSMERVFEVYPDGKLDEDGRYVSVRVAANPLFSGATYYLDGNPKGRKVRSILFHFGSNSRLTESTLKARFTVLFGEPTSTTTKGRAFWHATPRESIEVSQHAGYTVQPADYAPYWAK